MEDPSSVAASAYYYEAMMAKQQYPDQQEQLKCPRCDSPNTKFCYYNNYNLSQPRHFCKSCRRYWTKGGALRNVPIGGASRKNSKRSASSTSSSNKKTRNPDRVPVLTAKPESSPNRMLYGFPMGEQDVKGIEMSETGSFSSLLTSNMQLGLGGIFLNGSGWDSGLGLGNEGGYEQIG